LDETLRVPDEFTADAFATQNLCGDPFTGNIIYFFEQSKISEILAFRLGLGDYAVLLGVVPPTYWIMSKVGRRTLYIWGLGGMFVMLLVIGGLGVAGDKGNSGAKWGTVALIYVSNRASHHSLILINRIGLQHLSGSLYRSGMLLGRFGILVYQVTQ